MIALLGPLWKWLASFAAPLVAAFLLGVMWQNARHEKALRKALEAQDKETALAIRDNATAAVEAILKAGEAETQRKAEYESLETIIRRNRAPIGGCAPDLASRERVRLKTEAANGYALGAVSGGTLDLEGERPR